jgi:hypothetical protein
MAGHAHRDDGLAQAATQRIRNARIISSIGSLSDAGSESACSPKRSTAGDLAAHRHDPSHRPELDVYWRSIEQIAFATKRSGPVLRAVDAIPENPSNGKKKGSGEAKPPKRR